MGPTDRTPSSPWRRTWTGLAVLAVIIGLLYALVPYSQGTVAVEDRVVTVDCASPVVGMWRADDPPDAAALASGQLERRCPSPARERVAVGAVLVVAGAVGLVALRRRR